MLSGLPGSEGESSQEIHLPDKAVGVLVWLARHAGQVCGRDEILDAVWGVDRDVYDRVLDNAIRDVRRALGDSARDSSYIETIPKKGYRLIAEVTWAPATVEEPDPPRAEGSEPRASLKIVRSEDPELKDRRLASRVHRLHLLLALLLLVLPVAAYRSFNVPFRPLTVAVGDITLSPSDLTVRPEQELADRLDSAASCSGARFYRFRRLGFLASIRVEGVVQEQGGWLELSSRLDGLPSGDSGRLEDVRGPAEAGLDPIYDEVVQRIHDRIDREICDATETLEPRQACHCYQAGERLRGERRYEKALHYLERARRADPEHLGALDAMANVHHILGRDDHARRLLQEGSNLAIRRGPVEHLRFERRLAQVEGDYDEQQRLLLRLRELEPESPEWALALGWFYLTHRRNCRSSLELYRDALAGEGAPAFFYSYLGEAQLECGEPRAARESFLEYVDLEPLSPDAYDGLALALRRTGKRGEALEKLRRALELDPDYAPSWLQRGHIYRELAGFEEARRSYELYRESNWPNARSDADVGLARIELRLGRLEEAWKRAEEALRARSDAVEALWIQGIVALKQERWAEVEEILEQIYTLREGRSTQWQMEHYHHLRGRLLMVRGDFEKAIRAFHRAVELNPANRAFFHMAWAESFRAVEIPKRSVAEYRRILEVDSEHPDALCALAELEAAAGDTAEARKLLRRMDRVLDAAAPDPVSVKCRELLRRLETAP